MTVASCGRPDVPDIPSEWSDAVTKLGVRPVYPPTETLRLGTILLVDTSIALPKSGAPVHQETSLRITSDLEGPFEAARRKQFSAKDANRFFQSPAGLDKAVQLANGGASFYRQSIPKPTDGATVPPNPLPLAALPGFTLASVDQGQFAAFLPGLLASFFTSIGFRHTSYLRIEAEGIEVAELPLADIMSTLKTACQTPAFVNRFPAYDRAVSVGRDIFEAQRVNREQTTGRKIKPIELRLLLLRKVFYMRGVRFITEDSRVVAAALDAAAKQSLPDQAKPVSIPSVTVNNNPPAPPADQGGAAGPQGNNNAAIADLRGQINQLRTALANGSDARLSASFARAATTGVQLVQLFDRPLAFGYQALQVKPNIDASQAITTSSGWLPLCDETIRLGD